MDVTGRSPLSEHVFDHFAEDVSEAEVTALVAIGQFRMIDTHLVHHGGMKIMHAHWVFNDVV